MQKPFERVRDELERQGYGPLVPHGKDLRCRCPAHDDRDPSLDVAEGQGGRVLFLCRSRGCSFQAIMRALGLVDADGFPPAEASSKLSFTARVVATYDYRDEQGLLLFQTCRLYPKDFRQRRPNGKGGWIWDLKETRRVPYRLPELLAAPPDKIVFVVEGEKDVDALLALGLTATTNPMGAGKWKHLDPKAVDVLRGRRVVVLPDADHPGRDHAADVIRRLAEIAGTLAVLELPGLPEKGDVSDWLAAGHSAADLLRLANERLRPLPLDEPWEDPIPLDRPDGSTAPFPLDCLPKALAEFCLAIAEAVGCHPDYPATFALGIAAGAIGAACSLEIKPDYVESSSIYACVVAAPSAGKSPALKALAEPVYAEQARLRDEGDDVPAYVSDVTVEKLADLLRDSPRGLLLIRDELAAWVTGMNQYKAGKGGSDRQFYLAAWSGDPVSVHRKDPEVPPLFIRYPRLSVVGGIQPDVLAGLKGSDDGFFDRVLFSFPPRPLAKGEDWRSIPAEMSQRWAKAFAVLRSVPMRPGVNGLRPHFFRLNTESRRGWEEWTAWLASIINEADFPSYLHGPTSKLKGYAGRLALISHMLREAYTEPLGNEIDGEDMRRGVGLARYYHSHGRKVHGAFRVDHRVSESSRVLAWITTLTEPTFTRRDAYRALHCSFSRPEDLLPPLRLLEQLRYIRYADAPYSGTGRRPTPRYEINPQVVAAAKK